MIVGQFTKQGVNIKAGHRWSYLRLDHELELWIGKELIDRMIGLRPMTIRKMRGVQLLTLLSDASELAVTSERLVREFAMDHGKLRL